MENKEYFKLSRLLEEYHAIFYRMWEIGTPSFTTQIDTACIKFDIKNGKMLGFLFNPDFYRTLTDRQRAFVIAHEMLHVLLNHGVRIMGIDVKLMQLANGALDIVVNELLIRKFGFNREDAPNIDKDGKPFQPCFLDTMFPPDKFPDVRQDECFEYYFHELMKNVKFINFGDLINDHSHLKMSKEQLEKILKKVSESLSERERWVLEQTLNQKMEGSKQEKAKLQAAGNMNGNSLYKVEAKYNPKKKWETIIKKWVHPHLMNVRFYDDWTRESRRMSVMDLDNIILPRHEEVETKEKNRINLWFFQDTSGSCVHLAERFFRVAKTIPVDRFNLKLFCFDTQVYPVVDGKLEGFGGTSFTCIDSYIRDKVYNGEKYPDAIFVITDGCADGMVEPENKDRWHWFLSENQKSCIPDECPTYMLKEYE